MLLREVASGQEETQRNWDATVHRPSLQADVGTSPTLYLPERAPGGMKPPTVAELDSARGITARARGGHGMELTPEQMRAVAERIDHPRRRQLWLALAELREAIEENVAARKGEDDPI